MKQLQRFVILIGVFLLATSMISVAPVEAQNENILVVTSLSDINSLDPAIGYDTVSWPSISLVYRGLVTYSDDMSEIVGALAESYSVSDDGLTYTFTLRDGVKFSNGREISTEDVKYSFERMLDADIASPGAYMYTAIDGVEAYQSGDADEISGIRLVDDRTVEFVLSVPEWTFLQRMALPFGSIVAREGVEAAGDDFGRQPLGAGPFVLDSWEAGLRLTFSRNPNYYREGLPKVDGVVIEVGVEPAVATLRIESGEADTSLDVLPSAEYPRVSSDANLADNLMASRAFPNLIYLMPNVREAPFDDLAVREALNMAIDRERLVGILNGRATPASGPIPPSVSGNNTDLQPPPYDPDTAKAMLAKAGYPDGFSTQLYTYTDPTLVAVGQAVIADWAQIGVQVELVPLEFSALLDIMFNHPDEMPMLLIDWYLDYPDPSNTYEPISKCGGSANTGGYCNEDLDAVEAAAAAIPPGDERWAAFADLEAQVFAELPIMTLYHVTQYYYFSDRVQGQNSHPSYIFNFDAISVE